MQKTIDTMQPNDYEQSYALWEKTPGMGLSDADNEEAIHRFLERNPGLSFVCRVGGAIVGTSLCGHDGRRGYIYHVSVSVPYRGQGIGKSLVQACLQALRTEQIDKCHLFVYTDNDIGNVFWHKTGWHKRDDIFVYSIFL